MKERYSYKKQLEILRKQKENEQRDREGLSGKMYYVGDFKPFVR